MPMKIKFKNIDTGKVREEVILDKERTRCEVWSRVMGYYRPIDCWNAGKQSEQKERKHFKEPEL